MECIHTFKPPPLGAVVLLEQSSLPGDVMFHMEYMAAEDTPYRPKNLLQEHLLSERTLNFEHDSPEKFAQHR